MCHSSSFWAVPCKCCFECCNKPCFVPLSFCPHLFRLETELKNVGSKESKNLYSALLCEFNRRQIIATIHGDLKLLWKSFVQPQIWNTDNYWSCNRFTVSDLFLARRKRMLNLKYSKHKWCREVKEAEL